MFVARAWRRRLYGGVLTAAFVPIVLVAALATLALSGGFGQLGALAQALSGPPAPAATSPAISRPVPARVLAALSAPAPIRVAAVTPLGARNRARTTTRPGPTRTVSPAVGLPRAGRPGAARPVHRHPAPGRTPHPTPVDGIVSAGSSATSQVPGPAGQTVTQTLQSVASTVDKILPPLPAPHR